MIPFEKQTEMRKNIISGVIIVLAVAVGVFAIMRENEYTYISKDSLAASIQGLFGTQEQTEPHAEPLSESDPVRLRIPKIYTDTHFVPLGLQDNGEIEIPEGYQEVGWYTYGPTPGELGPSVVLGHVDSYEGPGVFVFLGQLKEGDLIHVDRQDGTTATFRVTLTERYDRDNFPTEKVYGNIDHAGIRLITCTGTYSYETYEYDRVLVVYGELVDDTDAQ